MKQAYQKPRMEWIDFNHAERIASSGIVGCEPSTCGPGANGCTNPTTRWNNPAGN